MFYVLLIYSTSHYVNHGHFSIERGSSRDHLQSPQSFACLFAADFAKTMFGLVVTINGNAMLASYFPLRNQASIKKNLSLNRQRVVSKNILSLEMLTAGPECPYECGSL